jgi:hypothetical protein
LQRFEITILSYQVEMGFFRRLIADYRSKPGNIQRLSVKFKATVAFRRCAQNYEAGPVRPVFLWMDNSFKTSLIF